MKTNLKQDLKLPSLMHRFHVAYLYLSILLLFRFIPAKNSIICGSKILDTLHLSRIASNNCVVVKFEIPDC